MIFPTPAFAVFFVVVWSVWAVLRSNRSLSTAWLVASSLFFASRASDTLIPVLCFVMALCLVHERVGKFRWAFVLAAFLPLAWFKYSAFLSDSVALGIPEHLLFRGTAPAGISFFSFFGALWLFEASGSELRKAPLLSKVASFSFFPSLLSGPISRPSALVASLTNPSTPSFPRAASLFSLGFFLKMVVAANLSPIADEVFASPLEASPQAAWMAVHAYSGQIYADFAGYTLMAMGVAESFGIAIPHNFQAPYLSVNISDFWRRWHITLSSFWREFLYIPLGGNRRGFATQAAALLFVMLVCGLWHGAGAGFLIWGGLHGIGLVVVSLMKRMKWSLPKPIAWVLCFEFVTVSWIPFRADGWETSAAIVGRMLEWPGALVPSFAALACAALLFVVFIEQAFRDRALSNLETLGKNHPVAFVVIICLVLGLSIEMSPAGIPNFIYFSF